MRKKIIFIFLDGIGLGECTDKNVFYLNDMPFLYDILECKLTKNILIQKQDLYVKGIDAQLGIKGIPQSATGQTSLFTGINAAEYINEHLPAFPNEKLITIIKKQNLFKSLIQNGFKADFANAYRSSYFNDVEKGKLTHSVTTHAVLAAKIMLHSINDFKNERAIFWDITNNYTSKYLDFPIEIITPEKAGKHILNLAYENDLIVFESFLPDLLGHKRDFEKAYSFINVLDRFLCYLYHYKNVDTTILITSDHGNFEDFSTSFHSLNKVPLIVFGDTTYFINVDSIVDITPAIIDFFIKNKTSK